MDQQDEQVLGEAFDRLIKSGLELEEVYGLILEKAIYRGGPDEDVVRYYLDKKRKELV